MSALLGVPADSFVRSTIGKLEEFCQNPPTLPSAARLPLPPGRFPFLTCQHLLFGSLWKEGLSPDRGLGPEGELALSAGTRAGAPWAGHRGRTRRPASRHEAESGRDLTGVTGSCILNSEQMDPRLTSKWRSCHVPWQPRVPWGTCLV